MTSTLNVKWNAPIISAEDTFLLKNEGTEPLPWKRFLCGGKDYLGGLEPGKTKQVPFDLIRIWFGDPRSVVGQQLEADYGGIKGDIAPREHEIARLCQLYGVQEQAGQSTVDTMMARAPKVSIKTEDGSDILTPAQDPDGTQVYGHVKTDTEQYDVATMLADYRNRIEQLEKQQAAEKAGKRNDGADVKHDGPRIP
jgi:hypothetical protein